VDIQEVQVNTKETAERLQQMKDVFLLQSDDEQGKRSSTVRNDRGNLSDQFDDCASFDQGYLTSPFPLDIDELQKQLLLHDNGEYSGSHSLVGFVDAAAYENTWGKAPNERMTVEQRCTESFFCNNFQDQQRTFVEEIHQKSDLKRMHCVDRMKQAVQLSSNRTSSIVNQREAPLDGLPASFNDLLSLGSKMGVFDQTSSEETQEIFSTLDEHCHVLNRSRLVNGFQHPAQNTCLGAVFSSGGTAKQNVPIEDESTTTSEGSRNWEDGTDVCTNTWSDDLQYWTDALPPQIKQSTHAHAMQLESDVNLCQIRPNNATRSLPFVDSRTQRLTIIPSDLRSRLQ